MLEYLYKLNVPPALFSVLKSAEFSAAFLLQTGILIPNLTCDCGKTMKLFENFTEEAYHYMCICGKIYKIFERTTWKMFHSSPQKLLFSILLWLLGTKVIDIHRIIGCHQAKNSGIRLILLKSVSNHFRDNLPKFRGTVEIDESCFKHSTTKMSRTTPEKWVFGLYERERKLVYMEVVQNRFASTLIPIIERICTPGTTIISDQWAAYNKLEDIGFPHYTIDHSRFFVHPHNREIHTQNIEISWGWAKFEIKRQNRDLLYLQELLDVYCWKRQFKTNGHDKKSEIAQTLNSLCNILKEMQTKKVTDNKI